MEERKADRVAQHLLNQIVAGDLPVGTLLPRENQLAEAYGVNRGVVREAVKLLEVHRLVRPKRRRGTAVLDPIASLSPEVIRAMLFPQPGQVDLGVFADLLEIRARLDAEMSALAAERRDEEDLRALDAWATRLLSVQTEPLEYARTLDDLSLLVAEATHNRIYKMLVHWHRRVWQDLGDMVLTVREPSPQHVQGLQLLLSTIRAQDPEATRRLVDAYHEWATPRLLEAAAARAPHTQDPCNAVKETP